MQSKHTAIHHTSTTYHIPNTCKTVYQNTPAISHHLIFLNHKALHKNITDIFNFHIILVLVKF